MIKDKYNNTKYLFNIPVECFLQTLQGIWIDAVEFSVPVLPFDVSITSLQHIKPLSHLLHIVKHCV